MKISKELKNEIKTVRRDMTKLYRIEKARLLEKCENEIKNFYKFSGVPYPKDPPARSRWEEIANSISHGLGALFSVAALVVMLHYARTTAEQAGAVVYFLGLFAVFSSSALYHGMRQGSAAKRFFWRIDYAAVYILIGATFCPIILNLAPRDVDVVPVLLIQWGVILLGILCALFIGPQKFIYPHIFLYLVLGWSALFILPSLTRGMESFFEIILLGGTFYTVGVIPCSIERCSSHFIWHIFVLAGAVTQCFAVIKFIYLV